MRYAHDCGVRFWWTSLRVGADADPDDYEQCLAIRCLMAHPHTVSLLSGTYYDGDYGRMQ